MIKSCGYDSIDAFIIRGSNACVNQDEYQESQGEGIPCLASVACDNSFPVSCLHCIWGG